jgi:hypothetical protein
MRDIITLPAKNVEIEIIRPQRINEKLQTNWNLKNIVLFVEFIPCIRKQSRFAGQ